MRKKPLSEQVVVVTGGFSGLGRGIARGAGEPKPIDAPDNLFDTLSGDPGAQGRFDDRSRGSTVWTRFRLSLPKG